MTDIYDARGKRLDEPDPEPWTLRQILEAMDSAMHDADAESAHHAADDLLIQLVITLRDMYSGLGREHYQTVNLTLAMYSEVKKWYA